MNFKTWIVVLTLAMLSLQTATAANKPSSRIHSGDFVMYVTSDDMGMGVVRKVSIGMAEIEVDLGESILPVYVSVDVRKLYKSLGRKRTSCLGKFCHGQSVITQEYYEAKIDTVFANGYANIVFPQGGAIFAKVSELGVQTKSYNEFTVGDVIAKIHSDDAPAKITAIFDNGFARVTYSEDRDDGFYFDLKLAEKLDSN